MQVRTVWEAGQAGQQTLPVTLEPGERVSREWNKAVVRTQARDGLGGAGRSSQQNLNKSSTRSGLRSSRIATPERKHEMTAIRTTFVTLALAGTAWAGVLAAAPAATASTADGPNCTLETGQETGRFTKTGRVTNNCPYFRKLKIVWARGSDGPCQWVPPHGTLRHTIARGIRKFNGAAQC